MVGFWPYTATLPNRFCGNIENKDQVEKDSVIRLAENPELCHGIDEERDKKHEDLPSQAAVSHLPE